MKTAREGQPLSAVFVPLPSSIQFGAYGLQLMVKSHSSCAKETVSLTEQTE
jgi:hypothetical protein